MNDDYIKVPRKEYITEWPIVTSHLICREKYSTTAPSRAFKQTVLLNVLFTGTG